MRRNMGRIVRGRRQRHHHRERQGERFGLDLAGTRRPEVEGPPERRGFGTVLAERGAITQLGGSIAHDWAAAGLTLRLDVPLERLAH